MYYLSLLILFFFKQKTAYEMRISDWSSDVCSSDLNHKYARRKAVSWLEAAGEQLCLLSPDMQNRRIIDRLTSRIGLTVHPAIVSNSFLGVCAHVRQGGWASIVQHSFFHVLEIGRSSCRDRVCEYV